MKVKLLTTLAAMALLALVAGCANNSDTTSQGEQSTDEETEILEIRMGVQPWVGNGPYWIAEEKGFDEKHGLKIETVSFEQDADVNAALASDDLHVANLATHTTMRMISSHNLDLKAIIFMDESEEADAILASEDVKTVEDLKGKRIAFEEGTTSELLLQQALSEVGMTLDDIDPVFMPASQAGMAMISGDVEIAVTYAPYISEVLDRKQSEGVHILYSGADSPGLISDLVVAKTEFFDQHPEAKEKLRAVWEESLQYWRDNEEEGNEIVANGSGITADELPSILGGLKFLNGAEQEEKVTSGDLMAAAENIQRLMLEGGSLKSEVNLEEMFDME